MIVDVDLGYLWSCIASPVTPKTPGSFRMCVVFGAQAMLYISLDSGDLGKSYSCEWPAEMSPFIGR
jgi:hypothetical protein